MMIDQTLLAGENHHSIRIHRRERERDDNGGNQTMASNRFLRLCLNLSHPEAPEGACPRKFRGKLCHSRRSRLPPW